ncbi:hypothetical protein GCM10027416_23710 [Okibacterium endophyticum]
MSLLLSRTSRPIALVTVAAAGVLLLSGCGSPDPQSDPTPSASSTQTAEPTTDPEATTEPTEDVVLSEPVGIDCDQLVTPEQMYDFNPNFSLLADPQPAADSKAGVIAGMEGLVCQWKNNTSGETIDVAVAKFGEDQLVGLKNLAVTESTPVPTYGTPPAVEGYFQVIGDQGEAQIFTGPYWLTLRSVAFFEPGDVLPLSEGAMANLP